MTENKLLQSALIYAGWGWHIHPLWPGDKRPLVKDWPNQATTDLTTIRDWWQRWPTANIGLACGASGLVVIDLDVKAGADGLATWAALGIAHDPTPTSRTPNGGRHLVFFANGAGLGNTASKLGAGVDTRGDGGYIVLPPSVLPDGRAWAWDSDAHPSKIKPVDLPAALAALLQENGENTRRPSSPQNAPGGAYALAALQGELGKLAMATEGTRNDTLNTAAFNLGQLVGAGLLDRGEVEARLLAVALAIGLGEREALATIKSGLDAGGKQPRQIPDNGRTSAPLPTGEAPVPAKPPPVSESGPAARPSPNPAPAEDTTAERLLSQGADDEGNAQCVKMLYGEMFRNCDAYGWMRYTGTHWTRDNAEAELDRAIIETLKARRTLAVQAEREAVVKATKPSAHNVRATKYLVSSLLAVSAADFDKSPDHINVGNGVLDLRTGKLVPHHPGQLFTYCLPVGYDGNVDITEWESWLLEAVGGDESVAQYLQLGVGYSLTGHTWEECVFYVYGRARAGKGTFTETILAMLGHEPLATETDFGTFTRQRDNDLNRADLAKLKPCRLVVASESAKGDWLNAAEIKRITGGNDIFCALKYRDHFSYRPQYAIWLVSNHAPKLDVEDDAAWARIKVIHFPNSYLGREDRRLKARMKQPAMLRQVLIWAVRGAMMWYGTGARGLSTPPRVAGDTEAARDQLDYVGQWLAECTDRTDNDTDFVSNATLHASYKAWCEENGVIAKGQTSLTQALLAKGYRAGERGYVGGTQYRGCYGIKLVEV